MNNYDFWEKWKDTTSVEKKAIDSVIKARDLVVNAVPHQSLVAIYVKGSFARREMKESSDVDMVPIVTEDKYERAIFGVNSPKIEPVCVVPLSLSEFKNNKLSSQGNYTPDLRAEPDLFLLRLKECRLIYGIPLNQEEYKVRSKNQILHDEIHKIRDGYIKAYQEGVIDFQPLLKEVFWLVEWEQNVTGKKVEHSFKGITESIKDKNHLLYDAFKFRINLHKSKTEERKFISKLEEYLDQLEKVLEHVPSVRILLLLFHCCFFGISLFRPV
ncbi:MAG: hypothetical protein Q8R37_01330 [Nanoarchaeota archaeon]|nr:hypothetical protein [Nanoarchaeota archaeon]